MPKVLPQPEAGGSRRSRGRRVSTSLSEINVIPLVDVMLVLLIIFMVAAPMLQRGVEVNLPTSRSATKATDVRMYITVPLTYRQDGKVFMDDEAVPQDVLPERMRQVMINKEQKEVFLRGDGGVQLQELMEVMDRLKDGGVERVGIVAMPASPRGRR
ncbi:MAG TPA: biopolymer transporter ExbD [Vicinamibacterales bacterium]|mgnify:CR=1 FL=1|nr:biopolymer transporter ExbD [Vicinamibacterales bacterium]